MFKNLFDLYLDDLDNLFLYLSNYYNVKLYERSDNEIVEAHNFAIRETSYNKLEELKNKYGLSIYKLTNIAIYNALNS